MDMTDTPPPDDAGDNTLNVTPNNTGQDLSHDLQALHDELHRLNTHRFVRIHNSLWRLLTFQFVRGLAFGLGSVVGATILVSIIAWSLSSIDFIPIIGEWASQIAGMINHTR
jgi:hypothetical protein